MCDVPTLLPKPTLGPREAGGRKPSRKPSSIRASDGEEVAFETVQEMAGFFKALHLKTGWEDRCVPPCNVQNNKKSGFPP